MSPARRGIAAADMGALLVPAAIIGGFFLGLYLLDGYEMPIGFDTARYLSETEMVAEFGLGGVESLTPPPSTVLASRVGFPIVVLALSGILSVSTFAVTAVLPAIGAVAVGTSAGALAARVLDRKPPTVFVVALVTGISPAVIRLVAPEAYTENLLAAALFMAALVLLMPPRAGLSSAVGASLLLAVAGLCHWQFFIVMAAVLLAAAAWLTPRSWRRWRAGQPIAFTPAGRIAGVVGGAMVVWAALLFGVIGTGLDSFHISVDVLREKLRADLSIYRFPLTLPLAALGGAALAMHGRRAPGQGVGGSARPALIVFVAWAAVSAASIGLLLLGVLSPAHRFLAFFLPLPVLTGVGLLAIGDRVARRTARGVGWAVVLAGVAGLLVLAARTYYDTFPLERGVRWLDREAVREVSTGARYLEEMGVPVDRPVVFIVDTVGLHPGSSVPLMGYTIRSALPAERYEHTYLYVGDAEGFLEGRPTVRGRPPGFDRVSRAFFRALEPMLERDPVAILPSALNPSYEDAAANHPGWGAAPGLLVVRGPRPATPLLHASPPTAPQGPLEVGILGTASLALVMLVGAGWGVAMRSGARWTEVLAIAPSFGIAVVVLVGVVIDAVAPPLGTTAILIVPVGALAGGAAAMVRRPGAGREVGAAGQPGSPGQR